MKMKPLYKWLIIAAVVIVALIVLYLIFKPAPVVPPNPSPQPQGGGGNLADSLASIVSGIFSSGWIKNLFGGPKMGDPSCQSANPGFDNNGYYTTKCGGVPGGGGGNCDPNNPGKDMNGFDSTLCGA